MSPEPEIVRFRAEHRQAVAELQTVLWGPDPAQNLRYLEWKYERNPWAVEPRIYLALRGGAVVGMRGFYESRWEVGAQRHVVSIPLADDLAIRESERNSGLVTRIMRAALADLAREGFPYVLSLSPGLLTMLGSLALGWKSAVRYGELVRCDRGHARRARVRDRLRRAPLLWRLAASPLLRLRAEREPFVRLDALRVAPDGFSIENQPRSEEMARLVEELGHDGRLRHLRSREYLDWRFASPMHEYRFVYAPGSGGLDGYLVLRARVMGEFASTRVWVCDLEGRSAAARTALLGAALEVGRFAELVVWESTLEPPERALLAERGFEPLDPQRAARGCPSALVRSTGDQPAAEWALGSRPLLDPCSWDLRMLCAG